MNKQSYIPSSNFYYKYPCSTYSIPYSMYFEYDTLYLCSTYVIIRRYSTLLHEQYTYVHVQYMSKSSVNPEKIQKISVNVSHKIHNLQ